MVYDDIFDAKNACDHLSGFNVCGRYIVVLYYQTTKVRFLVWPRVLWLGLTRAGSAGLCQGRLAKEEGGPRQNEAGTRLVSPIIAALFALKGGVPW